MCHYKNSVSSVITFESNHTVLRLQFTISRRDFDIIKSNVGNVIMVTENIHWKT